MNALVPSFLSPVFVYRGNFFLNCAAWSPLRLICLNFKKEIMMVLMIETIILDKLMFTQLLKVKVELYKLFYLYNFLLIYTWLEDLWWTHLSEKVGTTNQQKEEYRVKEDYFQRVTQALVMRLRQHEEAVRQEGKPVMSSQSVLWISYWNTGMNICI